MAGRVEAGYWRQREPWWARGWGHTGKAPVGAAWSHQHPGSALAELDEEGPETDSVREMETSDH